MNRVPIWSHLYGRSQLRSSSIHFLVVKKTTFCWCRMARFRGSLNGCIATPLALCKRRFFSTFILIIMFCPLSLLTAKKKDKNRKNKKTKNIVVQCFEQSAIYFWKGNNLIFRSWNQEFGCIENANDNYYFGYSLLVFSQIFYYKLEFLWRPKPTTKFLL